MLTQQLLVTARSSASAAQPALAAPVLRAEHPGGGSGSARSPGCNPGPLAHGSASEDAELRPTMAAVTGNEEGLGQDSGVQVLEQGFSEEGPAVGAGASALRNLAQALATAVTAPVVGAHASNPAPVAQGRPAGTQSVPPASTTAEVGSRGTAAAAAGVTGAALLRAERDGSGEGSAFGSPATPAAAAASPAGAPRAGFAVTAAAVVHRTPQPAQALRGGWGSPGRAGHPTLTPRAARRSSWDSPLPAAPATGASTAALARALSSIRCVLAQCLKPYNALMHELSNISRAAVGAQQHSVCSIHCVLYDTL